VSRYVPAELVAGVNQIIQETGDYGAAQLWYEQQLAAREAAYHGTRCPECGQTRCVCNQPTAAGAEPTPTTNR